MNSHSSGGVRAALATALFCGLIAAIGIAINAPLFALKLDDTGIGTTLVGVAVTIAGSAGVIATPIVPWLMGRYRVKTVLTGALLASSVMFLMYQAFSSVWALTILRFGFSTSLTIIFVTSEAWFLELAPERQRGRLLGLYAAVFAGGFGIGGMIIAQWGHRGIETPLIGAAIMALSILPIWLLPSAEPTQPQGEAAKAKALWIRFLVAPALFVPAFAMGAIETGAFNLFPLWVRKIGFDDSAAGFLIAASGLGNIVLQGPIGAFADRFGRNPAILLVAAVGLLGPIALMFIQTPEQAYGVCFIWSGCVTGCYTLGLMGLAETFRSDQLAGANAAYAASYGVGQMLAPVTGGALLAGFGSVGFLAGLACVALAPIIAVCLQHKRALKT